ncbi:MAG: phosphatase PAP2-related protein [Bacteroidota bacterium]
MRAYIRNLARAWRDALGGGSFPCHAILSVAALAAVLGVFSRFLDFVESRPGTVPGDPVLALFHPVDLTWLTFALIYLSILAGLAALAPRPALLVTALRSYTLMVLFRMAAMWLLPLDPPPQMIPLHDPFVQLFAGDGTILTRDLFFSGHTSTLFLLFLVTPGRRLRRVLLACTVLVAASVIAQHVHYSVDVFVAPFAAYGARRLTLLLPGPAGPHRN